ncbi:MAG: hypothetical protein ABIT05_05110 [Chitinophagaceae bacterium]
MKKILVCYALVACFGTVMQASPPDTTKYRINLPSYWKPGNKIWEILTDKLPLVCEELKDKELCGDNCNPGYSIEFEMSAPFINSYTPIHVSSDYTNTLSKRPTEVWDIVTSYSFECYLLLMDDKNKILTKFILVDSDETWIVTSRQTLRSYSPPPMQMAAIRRNWSNRSGSLVDNSSQVQGLYPYTAQEGQTPYAFINENKDKLSPTNNDLFLVVDRKIRSW